MTAVALVYTLALAAPDVAAAILKRAPRTPPVVAARLARAVVAAPEVPPDVLLAVMEQESRYKPRAHNGTADTGVMQVRPAVAQDLRRRTGKRYNLRVLEDNVAAGARHLAGLFRHYHGHWGRALTAYNKGAAGLRADAYRVGAYARQVLKRRAAIKKLLVDKTCRTCYKERT